MNDFRIARNDDETFTDEDTFVSERRGDLVREWKRSATKVREYVEDALSDDEDSYFATELAGLFISVTDLSDPLSDAEAAWMLKRSIERKIEGCMYRDAETQAQAEWENRQTGAPE